MSSILEQQRCDPFLEGWTSNISSWSCVGPSSKSLSSLSTLALLASTRTWLTSMELMYSKANLWLSTLCKHSLVHLFPFY